MSANGSQDVSTAGAKANWDDAEKYCLLLRIIDIYQTTHGKFDNKSLLEKYPDRTPKSLQHQWTRILNEIKQLGDGEFVAPTSGRKKSAATLRKPVTKAPTYDGDGEGDLTPSKPKRNRKRATDANDEIGSAKKLRALLAPDANSVADEQQVDLDLA